MSLAGLRRRERLVLLVPLTANTNARMLYKGSGCDAEDHGPNHVWSSAGLDRGLGMDNRRGRWRLVASLDKRSVAADQWLVRGVFWHLGLSGN